MIYISERPFLDIPEDSCTYNWVVSALDIFFAFSMILIYTPNQDLDTISDILWD